MNSNEFCFWLEGVVAATDRQRPNDAQWAKILARLDSLSGKATNTAMDGSAQVMQQQSTDNISLSAYGNNGGENPAIFAIAGGGAVAGGNLSKSSHSGNGRTAYCGSPPYSGLPG